MPIPVRKLTKQDTYPTDGFTDDVEHTILHCGNVDGNANKYYVLELQKNPDTNRFRLYSEYGRLGNHPARDLREDLDEQDARKEYERIKKSKLRNKTKARILKDGKEKHKEQYREVDIAAPTVGSPNIRANGNGGVTATVKTKGTLVFSNMGYESAVEVLLGRLHTENVHNIESSTNVTVTSNGLETPLGPVTPGHINTARDCLNRLQGYPAVSGDRRDPQDRIVRDLNSEFFSLIPQHLGRRITEDSFLLTDDDLNTKFDLLQGMEAAMTVTDANEEDGKKPSLGLEISSAVPDAFKLIKRQVETTVKHGDVRDWKVRRVFALNCAKAEANYRSPVAGGPEYDLFHGSANSNLLSIMLNGFYIPPANASHVTGRMFGNGVYGASASSKAFRYSIGLWGGRRSGMSTAYLFLVRFAMGKVYETRSARFDGAPAGFHSTWAKAGSSLLNDEYIVYNTNQAKVTHLIELSK